MYFYSNCYIFRGSNVVSGPLCQIVVASSETQSLLSDAYKIQCLNGVMAFVKLCHILLIFFWTKKLVIDFRIVHILSNKRLATRVICVQMP